MTGETNSFGQGSGEEFDQANDKRSILPNDIIHVPMWGFLK